MSVRMHDYQERDGMSVCKLCGVVENKDRKGLAYCEGSPPPTATSYLAQVIRERDEALAKVERLRNALACISLAEYESTSSASEKVHGHARIARKVLEETKP